MKMKKRKRNLLSHALELSELLRRWEEFVGLRTSESENVLVVRFC
jgi:hypothetical protein